VSPEELEKRKEARREQGRRLREILEKKRVEKLRQLEEELQKLESIERDKAEDKLDNGQLKEELIQRGF
jgi:hypothetical protein